MIDKGERVMHHITTHYIPAKRRHIDAETRLRRLSHVVAASTHVVRGCKLPPPVNKKKYSKLFYNCARIGSFRSVPAACYMRAPRPHGCGAWICARLREHPRGEAPLGLYRICFNSAPTPRRPSARFSPHAESRRPAFSVWAVDSSCPYPSSFGSVCNTVANARKILEAFATPLQTPESFSRHLQHCCKHQKVFRGTCNTVANTKKFLEAFATPLQAPKSFSRHLQHRCKHQKKSRGICNTVANVFFSENQALYKEPCPRSVINPFLS